jgi:hypothetical protein
MPLMRRALKVLSDREVSPQLGLLKSTLLQLDSTFTERDYGASTFRDFIEKMAAAGYVNLKQVDRSLLVELKEGAGGEEEESGPQPHIEPSATASPAPPTTLPATPAPATPSPSQIEEGVRGLFDAFRSARTPPHWPMYLRNVKQYVKNAAPNYDERRYGFANFLEAVRAAGRAGLFRLERNRQGILRIFAGAQFPRAAQAVMPVNGEIPAESPIAEAAPVLEEVMIPATAPEEEPLEAVAASEPAPEPAPEVEEPKPAPKRRGRSGGTSTKKKSTAARKTKKKAAGPDSGLPF